MSRVYNVIDADGHILEPLDIWDNYMDPKFRDRAPRLVIDPETGKEKLDVEGQLLGSQQGMGGIGGVGARQGEVKSAEMKYEEGRPGGFDPHKRIPDMDLDGIDAAFLYPSMGLFAGAVHDPELAGALCRAYNRWLADYCKPYPDRLFGVAMLPMQIGRARDPGDEVRPPRPRLPGLLPAAEPVSRHQDDQRPDVRAVLGRRRGSRHGDRVSRGRVERHADGRHRPLRGPRRRHIVSHTMEMMLACLAVIWGGVCEKHPKIRIGFLESGGGWIAPWLDRMDRHFDDQGFNNSGLKTRPERIVPAQLLDLVRAGRGQPQRAGGLYRPQQDHVGDRLPAPRRLLPRRPGHGARAAERHLARDPARRPRRRRHGLLRPELSHPIRSPPPGGKRIGRVAIGPKGPASDEVQAARRLAAGCAVANRPPVLRPIALAVHVQHVDAVG